MTETTRKNATLVRNRLQVVGQEAVASACRVDTSTVSRWVTDGRFDQMCEALAALGLKIMPAEARCVRNQVELDHLLFWARRGMDSVRSAADLVFEDPE